MQRVILFVLCFIFPYPIFGQEMNYNTFDNSILDPDATSVRFFLQDKQGLIWVGTNKGLYSYDGYESFQHFTPGSRENRIVKCGLFYKDEFLLMGSENGILMYNLKNGKYMPFEIEFTKDIRAMVLSENDLWLGCDDGIYRYNFSQKKIFEMFVNPAGSRKTEMINTLLADDEFVYVGAFGLFGRFSLHDYHFNKIESLTNERRLVNSMIEDKARNCIWIGEGHILTKYVPSDNSFESTSGFPVVKSMVLDCDNNLVLGTDNGLYIYDGKNTRHFVHSALKSNSLANNIIWSIFRDGSDNIWLGSDYGISLAPRHRRFDFIPVFQFSGLEQGNQFYTIFRDSRGYYWLGGDNGLIRTRQITAVDPKIRWYNMGNSNFYIPHNHIRNIFEDNENNLWVNTDYGVCKYDYQTEKFSVHFIISKDSSHNANWAYDIKEDAFRNMWVTSYGGGIFKLTKKQLVENNTSTAGAHYSIKNGLSTNNIDRIVFDKTGKIWALNHTNGVDIIDPSTGEVKKYPILNYTEGKFPTTILVDNERNIWVGFRNGVVCINPYQNKVNTVKFDDAENAMVFSLFQVEDKIWVTSNEGLWIIDKKEYSLFHINVTNRVFYSMYYDESSHKVLLGGVDGIAECSPEIYASKSETPKIIISSILVNNKKYVNSNNELAIWQTDEIELPFNQNNIVLGFSDLQYSRENRGTSYVFRLNKNDENWISLNADEKIYLNKLTPGTYNLEIAQKNLRNAPATILRSFVIIINPPWYYSLPAKAIYLLVLAGLILWIVTFFHQKQKLKYVRIEKEKTLEQTKMKVDFFTNIAHEFKTPLSLIIAPLSKLIQEKKNDKERNDLELIHQNAMKLNSLVQQAIEYYRDDSKMPMGLVVSRLEFIEFARSIFTDYESNMKERQLDFIFNSDFDELFIDVDVLKMESILNNLLSNACKYTNIGDSIILTLKYRPKDKKLQIIVSDTGPGIPEKDKPYIFQRFFQSSANKERGGTGIGLYLVKNFTELHGGTVNVFSDTAEGTTFVVEIPVIMNDIINSAELEEKGKAASKQEPLLLIVEDNVALAGFIHQIFSSEYRCVVAYNGKTGLKICNDLKPDVIISDIMMPVMDGLDMCQRIKDNIATSTIPIILLTAKDDKETELRSINIKIDAFIAKPFEPDILYSRVKQLLEVQKQLNKKIRIEKLSSPIVEKEDSEDELFLAHVTKIIEEQMANPDLNVSYLCDKVNISQKQLYRKIKHLTGLTAVDYIKSIRMKKAAILLSNKNFTVSEVMYKVGFSSHSYFAKCFHTEFGNTPGQFTNEEPTV